MDYDEGRAGDEVVRHKQDRVGNRNASSVERDSNALGRITSWRGEQNSVAKARLSSARARLQVVSSP